MMTRCITLSALALVLFGAMTGFGDPEPSRPITLATLLDEMTDLPALAEQPSPSYTCRQFSSYDPGAKAPGQNWFANADAGHYIRVEDRDDRQEYVMMDADGPGAVVRIWSANPTGTLRLYIDGDETPALTTPMADLLGGQHAPIVPPIAGVRGKGWNLYLPIPYATHCKITSDKGAFYYHVNYRTYAEDTRVVSFQAAQLEANTKAIAEVARKLAAPRTAGGVPSRGAAMDLKATVLPGQTITLASLKGPKAIHRLVLNPKAKDITTALRRGLLRMTFDGETTVEAPLGDFFGTAPGVNPYESLPSGMTGDGEMWTHWVMPFSRSARIELWNTGDEPLELTGSAYMAKYEWTDRSMLFHAKWRGETDVETRPFLDWRFLAARGTGAFVGASYQIYSPVERWWGEGDEKIYFDGQTFPSHFGTGTEDYFGYAWGCPELFSHAYHCQSRCDGPGTKGHNSLSRWHIMDRIPFESDFRFDMELWHWTWCRVNLGVTAYWYARPQAIDTFEPITAADLARPFIPEHPAIEGIVEGEAMVILQKTGNPEPQRIVLSSGNHHLWWHGATLGDTLVLGFDVLAAGKYALSGGFVKAHDYGILKLSVNNQPLGEQMDFYNPVVTLSERIQLGVVELAEGRNTFAAEIVGANERAVKEYMFGLDYLMLEPVK